MAITGLREVGKMKLGDEEITVYSDIEKTRKQLARFSQRGLQRATFRAMNKAAMKTKTFTGRLLAEDYATKKSAFKKQLFVSPKASEKSATVALKGTSNSRLPIYKWAARRPTMTPRGARFNAGGGSKVHPNTFIATAKSNHTGVFVRATNKRVGKQYNVSPTTGKRYRTHLPIRELTYPYVAHMITADARAMKIFKHYINEYPIQLRQQLDYEVGKSKGPL